MTFIAHIRFLDPSEGGRLTPANQGYRPTIQFEGHKMLYAGKVTFLTDDGTPFDRDFHVPRTVRAEVRIPNSELEDVDIKEGTRFWLTEGTHPVAECVVQIPVDTADYELGT
jgi:translation elongation factor EF-Tu-like GTPase